uniref:Uncharacterized protein n=1 Tax=Rhizophora mucronata TaxID=61149 RepID=A0A2P2MWY8_RHIMU
MILQSGGMIAVVPCRAIQRLPIMCLAANSSTKTSTEQLRLHLDQLNAEAESTRAQANSARLRLMRLSEAAENLKRHAAVSLNSGKENEARELLVQKKKVMQAVERSKDRISLLDELSAKLNEAISLKESQLIGNITSDFQISGDSATGPVRIVSPRQGVTEESDGDEAFGFDALEFTGSKDLQMSSDAEPSSSSEKELLSLTMQISDEDDITRGLKGISFYEDFLEHLDVQLNTIEAELVTIVNVSSLVLNDDEKPKNSKVQQTIELLESIRAIRQRIESIKQGKVDIS